MRQHLSSWQNGPLRGCLFLSWHCSWARAGLPQGLCKGAEFPRHVDQTETANGAGALGSLVPLLDRSTQQRPDSRGLHAVQEGASLPWAAVGRLPPVLQGGAVSVGRASSESDGPACQQPLTGRAIFVQSLNLPGLSIYQVGIILSSSEDYCKNSWMQLHLAQTDSIEIPFKVVISGKRDGTYLWLIAYVWFPNSFHTCFVTMKMYFFGQWHFN